jgi:hypothetical protein
MTFESKSNINEQVALAKIANEKTSFGHNPSSFSNIGNESNVLERRRRQQQQEMNN